MQVRVLTWVPGPHEELHGPQALHSVKLPLTVKGKKFGKVWRESGAVVMSMTS